MTETILTAPDAIHLLKWSRRRKVIMWIAVALVVALLGWGVYGFDSNWGSDYFPGVALIGLAFAVAVTLLTAVTVKVNRLCKAMGETRLSALLQETGARFF